MIRQMNAQHYYSIKRYLFLKTQLDEISNIYDALVGFVWDAFLYGKTF